VFYSVIETRDFSLFNQSAQALLKGYFIKKYVKIKVKKMLKRFKVERGQLGGNKICQ
jgi:phosphotransferase system  glucose/maltose/N-acetylglucosamine-specific IIC component